MVRAGVDRCRVEAGLTVGRRASVLALCAILPGCAVLPGLGVDVGPDPRSVVRAERVDARGLARAHVITFLEAARREERAAERVLGPSLTEDERLLLSFELAVAADVDAGTVSPDAADRRVAETAGRLASTDPDRRAAARRGVLARIPVRAAPFAPTFDAAAAADLPRGVCLGMTFYGVVGTRCALGDK